MRVVLTCCKHVVLLCCIFLLHEILLVCVVFVLHAGCKKIKRVIFYRVWNALWCCGISCYIFPCVERALVLWNFVLYFPRVERALVLWNFMLHFSACVMRSGIV